MRSGDTAPGKRHRPCLHGHPCRRPLCALHIQNNPHRVHVELEGRMHHLQRHVGLVAPRGPPQVAQYLRLANGGRCMNPRCPASSRTRPRGHRPPQRSARPADGPAIRPRPRSYQGASPPARSSNPAGLARLAPVSHTLRHRNGGLTRGAPTPRPRAYTRCSAASHPRRTRRPYPASNVPLSLDPDPLVPREVLPYLLILDRDPHPLEQLERILHNLRNPLLRQPSRYPIDDALHLALHRRKPRPSYLAAFRRSTHSVRCFLPDQPCGAAAPCRAGRVDPPIRRVRAATLYPRAAPAARTLAPKASRLVGIAM